MNNSNTSTISQMNNSSSSSITALVPGGVVTTQNISTVIKPKENNNSMQFVKIQTPELSKKAVEQIKIAQESKITKDKIKEVEEEWQSNLLNWKSKRRQQFVGVHSNDAQEHDERNNNQNDANDNGRKIKTFAEMIEQRAKTGNRLNFHLERYIGSSESDTHEEENDITDYDEKDDFVQKEISQLNLNKNHHRDQSSHNSLSHEDKFNCQSATINGNKNLNCFDFDKHPSNGKSMTKSANNSNNVTINHDNDASNSLQEAYDDDDDEDYVDGNQPINSTFKQGVEEPLSPPNHSDDRIKPYLDVDTRTKEFNSTARFEDNGSDREDEEDEQEEEQKQLQRIAFVAKLKAFEKLTQPSSLEPRYPPPRTVKGHPIPSPSKQSHAQLSQITTHIKSSPVSSIQKSLNLQPQSHTQSLLKPQQSAQQQHQQQQQQIHPRQQQQPVQQQQPQQQHKQPPQQIQQQQQQQQHQKQEQPPQQMQQQQQQHQKQEQPPQQMQQQQQHQKQEQPPQQMQQQQQHQKQEQPPQQMQQQQQLQKRHQPPLQIQQQQMQLQQPQHQPLQQQPLSPQHQPPSQPPPPQLQQPQQQIQHQQGQKAFKEEKGQDRTVLSVSGKKRCSSCKEELGRGAAAFVIESLNLVYHTNCFRCSVCHVNLSNGFRGVDVRVHAGALHCQNCYSKDGLNYSRV